MSKTLKITVVANGFVVRDEANTELGETVYVCGKPDEAALLVKDWATKAQEAMLILKNVHPQSVAANPPAATPATTTAATPRT